jgi:hypothetical protein
MTGVLGREVWAVNRRLYVEMEVLGLSLHPLFLAGPVGIRYSSYQRDGAVDCLDFH